MSSLRLKLTTSHEGKVAHVKLHQGQPQAPDVSGVTVVIPAVCVRIEPLRAHIGASSDKVRRLEISVDDFVRVQGSGVHILHQDRDVAAGNIGGAVTLDHVRRVRAPEDGDFAEDLAADGGVTVAVDDFEGVDRRSSLVAHFVNCAAVAVAEDVELLEIRHGERGGRGCGCGC
nr:hypothetical protein Csa_1G042985 [Ipomoea batatas]